MRHRVKATKLGRKKAPRKALLRNLATSLVLHEKIQTTETKAKAVQPIVEKLITTAKTRQEREAIRAIQEVLFQKDASIKMMTDLKKRYAKRSSGFTRIIPVGVRKGDGSPLVQIELLAADA